MKQKTSLWLQDSLVRVAKVHLALVALYTIQIIVFDASKLITPEVLLWRWYAVAGLAIVSILVLYLARARFNNINYLMLLAWAIIIADIAFAAFNVYTQRGMASRSVALFFIPIIVSAILLSRTALFTTAALCFAVYTTTAVAYFVNYFNEGYKIELYGEILFYGGLFLIAAGVLAAVLKSKKLIS